jgi:hypothetical protein
MSTWLRSAPLALVLAAAACKIPYPIVTNAAGAVVPPSSDHDPLGPGTHVRLVMGTPPGCRSLGLATGVGGIEDQPEASEDARYGALRAQALVSLRNAVGEAGGTHTRLDAEVRYSDYQGLTHVILRGPALVCGASPAR